MQEVKIVATFVALITLASAQCPWQRESIDLQSSCLCSYNLGHELSVQCDMVDWPKLLTALQKYATSTPLDLLYVNNSTIGALNDNIFVNLRVHNLQLSGCKINSVGGGTFKGLEQHLKNLNLQDNDLTEVPVESLRPLRTLSLLDLSHNRISVVPDGAFETLKKLATLKLSDNNVTLSLEALKGLEGSLKNLNLKGTRQKDIPEAVKNLRTLAFLDLSQNSLRELPGMTGLKSFEGLDSLTALNLERNLIQKLDKNAFQGVEKTLSSLSLLNNLLPDFPTEALSVLSELRVLDIGFNLLTELPDKAFQGNPSITLLALDGNPLATIPFSALSHLNNTLRGLSLGGRFLHCDCRLAWVIDWIRNGDLQVTSRERNPQFCGSPPRFRDRGFYSIQPEELSCKKEEGVGIATVVSADLDDVSIADSEQPPKTTTKEPTTRKTTITTSTISTTTTKTTSSATTKSKVRTTSPPWKNTQRPPLIMNYPTKTKIDDSNDVIVKNAFRQDNSVIIQWGSETANILGFRVVYRLFGDKSFKQGPPLEASEREFKIKNVPSQECIIVCVVSLEEINVTPETVPYSQCREVRTVSTASSNMDKITIAASAAICGTIVVAVVIFVAASRRRTRKMHELHQQKIGMKNGLPISGLPVNCCTGLGPAASPGGPLSSLATLSAFNNNKDWDQVSGYSTHSVQRHNRMYSLDQPSTLMADDMRSHFSTKGTKSRSIADGQSQNSFSNHSGRYLNAFPSNLITSRQDLRQSRQSLTMQSDRLSTRGPSHHGPTHSVASSRRSRPRSRSRDYNRPSSRYSTAGSTHTLNNYCDNSDNWTDHDMDIYMARNPTTRNGLVPL
ncbi:leucine-rich repeat transmembrane protein FLRT1 [Tribolium madens]|uniref:leucine-rich repeat transmembrane protein FLRT1 n=1 Tax=Tribolium madens TaxID=41895 RepID=UPI001CF75ABE|nr:leucine-rich repeat transmembrane protein FLRT1 [Tribolium madens]XP_044266892.1 leucine-rich repeat transmembrane protein FLRT1 [Tribolium madens]